MTATMRLLVVVAAIFAVKFLFFGAALPTADFAQAPNNTTDSTATGNESLARQVAEFFGLGDVADVAALTWGFVTGVFSLLDPALPLPDSWEWVNWVLRTIVAGSLVAFIVGIFRGVST